MGKLRGEQLVERGGILKEVGGEPEVSVQVGGIDRSLGAVIKPNRQGEKKGHNEPAPSRTGKFSADQES